MSQRVYCDQSHPGSDEEAEDYCRRYHRPTLPAGELCALDKAFVDDHFKIIHVTGGDR